jgi:hypothetical protein
LLDDEKKREIEKHLFYVKGKGQSYELKVILPKLFTDTGSVKSILFLNKLS